jgi:hypothetical protein
MRKIVWVAVAISLAGTALAGDAVNRWNLRLGGFYPGESSVRDATDNVWPAVGVDWLLRIGTQYNSTFQLSVDWLSTNSGPDYTITPVTFGITWNGQEPQNPGWRMYAGLGAGWYFVDSNGGGNDDKFGGYLNLGWMNEKGQSLDLRYHWFDEFSGGADAHGLVGAVGFRF